ncbi:MAG: IPT/TIG domain-containing protein [Acidimicrobiales bacterium]
MAFGALVLATFDPRLASSFHSSAAGTASNAKPPRSTSVRAAGVGSRSTSGPVLSGLGPSSGSAGQSVILSGRGFFSPTGQIVAYFGVRPASTVCFSQSTCRASVPPRLPGSPRTVAVTVTTEAGRSNGIEFSYLQ